MDEQLNFVWFNVLGSTEEQGTLTLSDQIAHAQALLANGARLAELTTKRESLITDLAAVDEDLAELLGPATTTNGSTRAKQKCSLCQSEEHNKRNCPTKGAT